MSHLTEDDLRQISNSVTSAQIKLDEVSELLALILEKSIKPMSPILCPTPDVPPIECNTVFDCETSQNGLVIYDNGTTNVAAAPYNCAQAYQISVPWVGCDGLRPTSGDVRLSNSADITFSSSDDTGPIPINIYDWNPPNTTGQVTYQWGNVADPSLCSVTLDVICETHTATNFRFDGHGGEAVDHDLDSVYAVTNLNGSGAGSLEAAPAGSYVVFPNLSGTINSPDRLLMNQNRLWVMGQTSPAGIQVRGGNQDNHQGLIEVRGDGQIWQHLRVRPDGPLQTNNCCHGPFIFFRVNGGVADHMSFYWGDDDNLDVFESSNVTIQNSLIAESLDTANESGRGSIASNGSNISYMRNLFAHHNSRMPFIQDILGADVVNNIMYNGTRDLEIQSFIGTPVSADVECNVEIKGANSSSFWQDFGIANSSGGNQLSVYINDNKVLQNASQDCQNAPAPFWFSTASGATIQPAPTSAFTNTPHGCPRLQKLDVCNTLAYVTANAGASHNRDALDARIVQDVLSGSGSVISSPGPWPAMSGGNNKNPWDMSKPDLISDAIKQECGLDPAAHQNTTQTNTNGGNVNDFLYIMDYCFGL